VKYAQTREGTWACLSLEVIRSDCNNLTPDLNCVPLPAIPGGIKRCDFISASGYFCPIPSSANLSYNEGCAIFLTPHNAQRESQIILITHPHDGSHNNTQQLEREHRVAASLRETLRVLNSNRTLDEILQFIVRQAREILYAQAAAIYRPVGQSGIMQIQAHEGLSEQYVREARIPFGRLATGNAAVQRRPVAIPDVNQRLHSTAVALDADSEAILIQLSTRYRAMLAVPMIFPKGEVYGTLDLYFNEPQNFDDEDIVLACAYSDQAVLAIENARLSQRVEQAAILSERDRLARDLHDTVTQTLFSASLIADVLPVLWEQDENHGRMALQELRKLSCGALAEMRMLLFELRPEALLQADIFTLLRQQVEAFTSRTRIPAVFQTERFECQLPADAKIALYRVTQELLHNIEKHAQASHVTVIFDRVPPPARARRSHMHCRLCKQCVRLVVVDDGRGFNAAAVTSDHMGLKFIRERVKEIGGSIQIDARPGEGTRVEVVW